MKTRLSAFSIFVLVLTAATGSASLIYIPELPTLPGLDAAHQHFLAQRFDSAEESALQLLQTQRELGNADGLAMVNPYLLRAKSIYDRGRTCTDPGARSSAEEALRILELHFGPNDSRLLGPLGLLMDIYDRLQLLDAKRLAGERRLVLLEHLDQSDEHEVASTLNKLGGLCMDLGDLEECERYYRRALAIRERLYDGTGNFVAASLNNLALVHQLRGDLPRALDLHRRALDLRLNFYGPDHFEVGQSRCNLAEVLLGLGRREEAREQAEQSIAAYTASIGSEHWDLSYPYSTLVEIEQASGRPGAAHAAAQTALRLRLHGLGSRHPLVAESRLLLARVLWSLGDEHAVHSTAAAAEESGQAHLRLVLQTLSEWEGLLFARTRPKGIDLMLATLDSATGPQEIAAAWEALINQRSLVQDEMIARSRVRSESGTKSNSFEVLLGARRELLAHILGGPRGEDPASHEARTMKLRAAADEAERILAREGSGRINTFRSSRTQFQTIHDSLESDETLVAYARYEAPTKWNESEPTYLALILPAGDRSPQVIKLGPAAQIDSAAVHWRGAAVNHAGGLNRLTRSEELCRSSGQGLSERIWAPVAAASGSPERIFLVADGELLSLPFGALPVGSDQFLIETGPDFVYLNGERDLLARRCEWSEGRGLLAIGNPDFSAAPEPGTSAALSSIPTAPAGKHEVSGEIGAKNPLALSFPPLPAAELEIRALMALWGERYGDAPEAEPGTFLLGAQASETLLRNRAPGTRLLHLATHGYFLGERERAAGDETPANPMLLSGLAFAGAGDFDRSGSVDDDGLLTVKEISLLDLSSVECAVLSACATGRGIYEPGEGLIGLRRAFQAAGVRSLVLTPWPLRDEWARPWMAEFYDRLLGSDRDASRAAKLASLAILDQRRNRGLSTHPAAWGAMIAIGPPMRR